MNWRIFVLRPRRSEGAKSPMLRRERETGHKLFRRVLQEPGVQFRRHVGAIPGIMPNVRQLRVTRISAGFLESLEHRAIRLDERFVEVAAERPGRDVLD